VPHTRGHIQPHYYNVAVVLVINCSRYSQTDALNRSDSLNLAEGLHCCTNPCFKCILYFNRMGVDHYPSVKLSIFCNSSSVRVIAIFLLSITLQQYVHSIMLNSTRLTKAQVRCSMCPQTSAITLFNLKVNNRAPSLWSTARALLSTLFSGLLKRVRLTTPENDSCQITNPFTLSMHLIGNDYTCLQYLTGGVLEYTLPSVYNSSLSTNYCRLFPANSRYKRICGQRKKDVKR